MFGIKISCESCCDFARPLMQQMFCATRLVNLSDLSCDFTQAYVANVCQVGCCLGLKFRANQIVNLCGL